MHIEHVVTAVDSVSTAPVDTAGADCLTYACTQRPRQQNCTRQGQFQPARAVHVGIGRTVSLKWFSATPVAREGCIQF